ncbi:ATP-binding protein [Brevibacillus borstelensis]|uniref:ATP-binding protein n=1 Tax=Brevibacillus borstelensis TaxID=45462 RepID=UPI0030C2D8A8
MKNQLRLRYHLTFAFALIALVPILVMGVIQVTQLVGVMRETEKSQELRTGQLADAVETYVYQHKNAVETLAASLSARSGHDTASLVHVLRAVRENWHGFVNLYVADKRGITVAFYPETNSIGQSLIGENFSDRDYFKKVSTEQKTTISSVFLGRSGTYKPLITIAVPIFNEQRQFDGYVLGALDLTQVEMLVTKYDYGSDTYPVVLDQTGRAVYHPDTVIRSGMHDLHSEPVYRVAYAEPVGSGIYYSSMNKQSEFVTYKTIPELGWVVSISRPVQEINNLFFNLIQSTIVIVIVTLLVTFGLGALLAKRLNQTIHLLVDYTQRLAEGNFDVSYEEMTNRRVPLELGLLARHFSIMGEQIEENRQALLELNADLERRIEARTLSLSRKNNELEIVNTLITPIVPSQGINHILNKSLEQAGQLLNQKVKLYLRPDSGSATIGIVGDWREPETWEKSRMQGVSSFLIPLRSGSKSFGYLAVEFAQEGELSLYDQQFLHVLANSITIVLENEILLRGVQHRHATLNAVLESMSDAVVLVDIQKRVVYANRCMSEMFGIPQEEVAGMKESELFSRIGVNFTNMDYAELIRKENVVVVCREMRENGKERYLQLAAFQVSGEDRVFGRGYVWRDITKEHEVDRLKNDLISLASHEFKTPITSIKGSIETLLRSDAKWDEEFKQELLEGVHEDIRRIQELVNDWLDISKIDAGAMGIQREPIRVAKIVEKAVGRLRTAQHSETQLDADIREDLPAVFADKLRIEQVLVNLFTNAIRYNDQLPRIRISADADEEFVHIRVEDNGIGIHAEHLDKIFDRFYRVDVSATRRTGGTGLGLAICKGIMEAHGGMITVQSKTGEGSAFTVSLPIYKVNDGDKDAETEDYDRG